MKVRIIDLHRKDGFSRDKVDLIGLVGEFDGRLTPDIELEKAGWKCGTFIFNKKWREMKDTYFYAVKVEEIKGEEGEKEGRRDDNSREG